MSDKMLKFMFERSLVPWLEQQRLVVERRFAQRYRPLSSPSAPVNRLGNWLDGRSPDQLASSLATATNGRLTQLTAKLMRTDVQTLRSVAVDVLPHGYDGDAGFISDLVVLTNSTDAVARD